MKSFTDYLTESKRVYAFKVGIAGDLPENCEDDMERCLQKFGVSKMSAGKKTPIQERPLDFPQLENCEVHYYEIELMYPTTSQILQEYIGHCCGVNQAKWTAARAFCKQKGMMFRVINESDIFHQGKRR